ncbi:ABC transporter substrate-binding protein [Sphaerobacter sp.]|uniref:ABC transporter substrate-binding protein n=1 Tax=Sphaerobacter sp. TaxID=2099654 RepID=UPI001DD8FFFD|nr:ABC transporter substrate-binding protein [Sphaerobacter sp.]MBX5443679.1 ABC transporter substrate-binding protein [Sphaerobacter sp.]
MGQHWKWLLTGMSRRRFVGGALAATLLAACGGGESTPTATGEGSGGSGGETAPTATAAAPTVPANIDTSGSTNGGLVPPKAPESNLQSTKQLTVGMSLDPTTLNPVLTTTAAYQSIYAQILEQLVIFGPDGGSVSPWLAESFEWVDDTTLELRLRQGISFTNGEPFDAESVKFSIDAFAAAKAYAFMIPPDVYKETEVVDEYTARVHLNRPYAPFIGFLARGGAALPPKYYAEVGEDAFGQQPIGTGPFVLAEWVKDDHITLKRNDDYWNGPHPVATVTYRVIPEDTARLAALETGEIDLAMLLPVSALNRLNASDTVDAVTHPGLRKFALHFDTKTGPEALKDKRVRIALNLAVDKQAIVDGIFQGAADPMEGQWEARQEFGFNPNISMFPYDVEQAKALLAEAGYADGFDLQVTYTVGRYPQDKELGEIVCDYIKQVGVNVIQRPLEYGTFTSLRQEGTLGSHQWGLLLPPEPYFNYGNFVQGSAYETHDLGDEYSRLVDEASRRTDLDEQLALYHQAAQIMHDDPPMLFLVIPQDIYGVSKRVRGFQPRTDQVLWLFTVDVD